LGRPPGEKGWGRQTFTAPAIAIDFRVGGKALFCMRGKPSPEAPEQDFWSTGTYKEMCTEVVGSPYPGGGEAPKGLAVRQLKRYVSWVQTVKKNQKHRDSHGGLSPQGDSNKPTHIGETLISIE